LKTGLFVSPHLVSFRERVQVNAELISEEAFVEHLPSVLKLCADHSIPATLFELTFILACLHYEREKCQVVVLEVGLGGELDATNVVNTALSILCSVSLDHTRILGSTVDEIATKKAGIFKKGVPALVGPGCPMTVIERIAATNGAELNELQHILGRSTKLGLTYRGPSSDDNIKSCASTGVRSSGSTSKEDKDSSITSNINSNSINSNYLQNYKDTDDLNAHIAFGALCILSEKSKLIQNNDPNDKNENAEFYSVFSAIDVKSDSVQIALQSRPPCRWEELTVSTTIDSKNGVEGIDRRKVDVEVVLDVGHNPAAMEALSLRIHEIYPHRGVRVLYAMSRDKDVRTCVKHIIGVAPHDHIHFVQVTLRISIYLHATS
jgi:folylpolyglutamate synthase/dihydropteroate synthase